MRRLLGAFVLAGTLLIGCAGQATTAPNPTPLIINLTPTPAATPTPTRTAVPTPTVKPTPTPKPTPKPPYPDQWLWYACKTLTALGAGAAHVDAAGHYVLAGDWGMVRVEATGAHDEGLNALQLAAGAPVWRPAAAFRDAAESAAASVGGVSEDWDLAATFQTVDTATQAEAVSSVAVAHVKSAVDLFNALSKKYHFDCRTQ